MGEKFDLNNYKVTANGRIDLSKTFSSVPLPDLCDVQIKSFNWFIGKDLPEDGSRISGTDEVFNDIFPISSDKGNRSGASSEENAELSFVGNAKWGLPKFADPSVCKTSGLTYSAPLRVTLRLRRPDGTIVEDNIFMGDFPVMTPSGTFIINGSEKCIASQLVRSPGAYLTMEADEGVSRKIDADGIEITNVYGSDIIPARGKWLEFLTDSRDYLSVRIDKTKKIPALTLLRAIGLTSDLDTFEDSQGLVEGQLPVTGILAIFGDNSLLRKALEKNPVDDSRTQEERSHKAIINIFHKLRPGEPCYIDGATDMLRQNFFAKEHYDLGKAGRFKIQQKLGIYNRLVGVTLAEDLVSKDGEIVHEAGTTLSVMDVLDLKEHRFFEGNENHTRTLSFNPQLFANETAPVSNVNIVKIFKPETEKVINVVGTDLENNSSYLCASDIIASLSYMLNLIDGVGEVDDTDHLGNKRVRCVGELIQEKFRNGLSKMKKNIHDKMSTSDLSQLTIQSLINIKALTSAVSQFFNSDQLSQFMDQTNPLAELTNKRRLSALGRGGLSRDRASTAVRDVHPTHYGRICPIETPEGANIGLISNLACYARVNQYGFIETPYRPVVNGVVNNDPNSVVWLTAAGERNHIIAQASVNIDPTTNEILDATLSARSNGEYITARKEEVDLIDASPKQIVSIAAACIPFLENDDGKRALMGSNMQRQALPLLDPKAPLVGTGIEDKIAHDSGEARLASFDGTVTYVDSTTITIEPDDPQIYADYLKEHDNWLVEHEKNKGLLEPRDPRIHDLLKFNRSNKRTCINQTAIVKVGQKVKAGQIIADGPSMDNGELALGQNVVIAFTTWHGYNYEDAILISQKCVSEDLFTNIIIEERTCERRKTKLGNEEFTRDVPNVSEDKKAYLDERGVVIPGTEVKEGDILVGKTTPKGETTVTNNDNLLKAIFSAKNDEDKDASLRVRHGEEGTVLAVKHFSRIKTADRDTVDELPNDVLEQYKIYVVQKRKIQVGDKMSGRHGNKGVISKVLPVEDMPYLPDGTPVDILLSPMGVPSRMNIGQVLEVQLGLACKKLGIKVSTPVFDGATNDEIAHFMEKAGIDSDGKTVLYDGQTGERFDSRVAVGVMYMIKLDHMVEDKLHARATGPYSLVTQQPLGGKAQRGGQRFGEMEVWALEAYGAAYTLQEMLTIKSDDTVGRNKTYEAILRGREIPKPNMPESTRVLIKELQGLAINVTLRDDKNRSININTLAEEAEKDTRRTRMNIETFDKNKEDMKASNLDNIYIPEPEYVDDRNQSQITDIDEND